MKIKNKTLINLETPVKVYDLTAEKDFNFLLENGIVVHNCADGLAGAIEAINRDLEIFTYLARPFVQEQYTNHMKMKTITNKQSIMKDMKKIMRDGGMQRFINKEQERLDLLRNIPTEIPQRRRGKRLGLNDY